MTLHIKQKLDSSGIQNQQINHKIRNGKILTYHRILVEKGSKFIENHRNLVENHRKSSNIHQKLSKKLDRNKHRNTSKINRKSSK